MREKRTIKVKPVEGRRITLHDAPDRVISGERTVPEHPHYRRAIARGDLELVTAKASTKSTKKEG